MRLLAASSAIAVNPKYERVAPPAPSHVRATLFQTKRKLVGVPTFAQSRATCVWSAVRVVLVAEPISLTSLKALVYSVDGKMFAYIRGKWQHDAVLIEGLR